MPFRFSIPLLSAMLSTFCSFVAFRRATWDSTTILPSPPFALETPLMPLPSPIHNKNNTQPVTLIRYRQSGMPYFLREAMSQGNMLCRDVAEQQNKTRDTLPQPPSSPIQYSLQLECQKLFYQNSWGTGNVLQALYGLRLAARVLGNIEVRIRCKDAARTKSDLVVPWMAGTFVSRTGMETPSLPFLNETCLPFSNAPVHYLMDEIRYELRRMAIVLVGVPYPTHPAADFVFVPEREQEMQVPMPETPLLPNIELDDVAIHFRCGDIVELQPHHAYGYARFSFVANYISSEARSIGIVTQPFQGQQQRRMDGTEHTRCPILIGAFQQYLQDRFPNATVQIRNSSNETVALSYARFIMANQSLAAGISTFVYFPFMATFGTGYLQKPLYVEESFEERVNSQFIEYSDLMNSVDMFRLWKETNGREQITKWFTNEES
jgi:hypothetical protein